MTALNIGLAVLYAIVALVGGYVLFLTMLTIPFCQNQAIYLNAVKMTWFKDLNAPETWGFLHNQVTPFTLGTPDGEILHAWHILPLNVYRKHEQELISEIAGMVHDIDTRLSFRLLRDDPEARLVLYYHGAGGTLGSGFRSASYRAISAAAPDKVHIMAINYRGFGESTGSPSEQGLLTDALTLSDWALNTVGIPQERIAIFSQSLGTAVSTSLVQHLATRSDPIFSSGMVLVAPFADVKQLTATYRVAGIIPLLSPAGEIPGLLSYLNTFIKSKWPSKDKLTGFVRHCEGLLIGEGGSLRYQVSILHAEDDYDIPSTHSDTVFWHAVSASSSNGITFEDLDRHKKSTRTELRAGGWTVTSQTDRGVVRQALLKHGLHDKIMSYPIVSLEIARALRLE